MPFIPKKEVLGKQRYSEDATSSWAAISDEYGKTECMFRYYFLGTRWFRMVLPT